jgi:uncharacterized protein YbjT (DUF2867 family)
VNSEKAKPLKEKVTVVEGDILKSASLETALAGAHTVFAVTTPVFTPDGMEAEYNHAKTIADVAVKQGVAYFIFNTILSPPSTLKQRLRGISEVFPSTAPLLRMGFSWRISIPSLT